MVQITDSRIGGALSFAPLPALCTPRELLADALPVLDPPSRLSVTDAAERFVRIEAQGAWQDFDRSVTPYMVEPTDMTQSRLFKGVAFVGPSQSGKTKMLETVAYHAVTCDQRPTLIIHMTKGDRDKWVEEKVDPVILNSPELFDRLGKSRDDSTFSRKRFRGMRLTIGYPTPTILSGGTYGLVLLTDYDHMPLVLGGADNPEGSPFRMGIQRIRSFLSRGCVLAEGSPARPVTDVSWRPRTEAPHEMPPVAGGIVRLYNQGTRARWHWECPECGEEFEPNFDLLDYDDALDPGAAGELAVMCCPNNGCVIEHRHKMELNRRALAGHGGWRHEAVDGRLVTIDDPEIRKTNIASYALNGAAATFSNWSEMVSNYIAAVRIAETLGDESELSGVHYTEIGIPHRRLTSDDDEIGIQFLRDHMQPGTKGIAPGWTRFITISVDVQGTYFPVQFTAWGTDGSCQVVDRFDLTQPPANAPNATPDEHGNQRRLDPSRYLEDWAVLEPLAHRIIPVAGEEFGLKPIGVVVDFQGKAGVPDNAEAFLMARKRAGEGAQWRLSRGRGGFHMPFRTKYEFPEGGSKGKAARNIKLLTMATDRLKDTVDSALRKSAGGSGAMYLGDWMTDEDLIGEFVAEERLTNGWEKKQGVVRNEGTDLSVQARALAEHKGLLRLNPDRPLPWAVGGLENINAVSLDTSRPSPSKSQATRPTQINFLKR